MTALIDTPARPLIMGTRSIIAWQQAAKTQTRRLVKPQPLEGLSIMQGEDGVWVAQKDFGEGQVLFELIDQPRYAVGDLLWIREGLKRGKFGYVLYGANPLDYLREEDDGLVRKWPSHWKRDRLPAMFMPRWACRYYARVVSVRPERLQDISVKDAVAEGYPGGGIEGELSSVALRMACENRLNWYFDWWDSMHKKPGTRSEDNPWVWVYGLEAVDAS